VLLKFADIIRLMISIVIPAHNQADILEKSVKELVSFLKKCKYDYEILIAEDGSVDGTYKIASNIASKNSKIRVLHSRIRRGKGGALKYAFSKSKGDFLIFSDADLSAKITSLPEFVKKLEGGYDICIGSRFLPSSKVERSFSRSLLSRGYNFLAKILFNTEITDLQCGLKGFRKETLPILLKAKNNSWFWDTEALILAERNNLRICQIPVVWKETKRSKVNKLKDSATFLIELIKLRWNLLAIKQANR
jgi:hypothetical protein